MYEINVESHFYASHELALPDGSNESVHFHNWSVTADICSENLNDIGIVMDFRKLKQLLENITSKLEKKSLNSLKYFKNNNPSAENVARFIFEKLEPKLPKNVKLACISVIEEPLCRAKYRR